jgi:hypothetical protein
MLVDFNNNTFIVEASGLFNNEIAQKFINEYYRQVKMINPSDFYLIINCKELLPVAEDNYQYFKEVIKMYIETNFKKRFCVVMNSTELFSQIMQLDPVNFLRYIFLDSIDKIMETVNHENNVQANS